MSAHTPGPWKLEMESRGHLVGFVISAPKTDLHPVICEVFPRPYPVAISEANARLLVVAPDMFSVLASLIERIETCTACDGSGQHPRRSGEACDRCGGTGEVFRAGVDGLIGEIRDVIAKVER